MSVTAIVGANWGDEGKGKMTDYLAEKSDIVTRFQGGNNAGHTIINNYGKFSLHLLPSGVFYPHVTNVLGTGVALNIAAFLKELEELNKREVPKPKILISDRAQVLLPYHKLFDCYEEERLGKNQFGSTQSGIAPFYGDKYSKLGIQVSDLFDEGILKKKLTAVLEIKNVLLKHLYNKPHIKIEDILPELLQMGERIKPYVTDTTIYLNRAIKEGKKILAEGQLGALRDPDHGIYPYSTSSSTLAGFAAV
jgi:adenylosuccinate synthase